MKLWRRLRLRWHKRCKPPGTPQRLDQAWTCPICGTAFRAFNASELPAELARFIPETMLGWTDRPPGTRGAWERPGYHR